MRVILMVLMFSALLFAQAIAAAPDPASAWVSPGISGGLAGLILYFWRQDRRDRAEDRKELASRNQALALDYRAIVEANTVAITKLTETLGGRMMRPFKSS